ncbi:MAG: HEAT repeat domain-containing protein [Planctomycetes bacterium]|nr:HEAT repeat domain-containing protein [Planctomycetota bacterium]
MIHLSNVLVVLLPLASNLGSASVPTLGAAVGAPVQSVAGNANPAWIADLATDLRWRGGSADEGRATSAPLAFQGPPIPGGQRVPQGGPSVDSGRAGGGSWRGPGDTVAPGGAGSPSTGAPRAGGQGGGPSSSSPQPGSAVPTGGGGLGSVNSGAPATPTLAMEVDDGWWLWWEYNKTEFLRPNGLAFWRLGVTGDDAAEVWRKYVASTRTELSKTFASALSEDDAGVRRAAVDALGKVAGSDGVPSLVRALDDRSVEVRHHAILALGASGAPEAIEPLLQILRTGNVAGRAERLSPIASAVAICALGLGRKHAAANGFDEHVDNAVIERTRARAKTESESIATAAFVYQRLAPCAELEALAFSLAEDRDESPSVRCRAIEALSASKDPKAIAKLRSLATGGRLDERRSAVLALGGLVDGAALPALQAAYGVETEPLTRGFVLLSIARQGGEEAGRFLLDVAREGRTQLRPWSALALGLYARDEDMPEIRKFLRDGVAREKSREMYGAWWLAIGLARDVESRGLLREALSSGVDARQKMYAATALALIGDLESAAILRERMRNEDSAFLRAAFASSLSLFGLAPDAAPIAKVLAELRDPTLQGLASSALAYHGSREALEGLNGIVRANEGSRLRRAAAIEALAMMLGTTRPYSFGDVSRQANYTVFSDWFEGMLQVSL